MKSTRATPAQREYIRRLLRDCELPTDRFGPLHHRVFKAARVPAQATGSQVDSVLAVLTPNEASRLVNALKSELGT